MVHVAIDADLPMDPAAAPVEGTAERWLDAFAQQPTGDDGYAAAEDLPVEMAAELDNAQGFQVEELGGHRAIWQGDRGDDYEANFGPPRMDQLRRAHREERGEAVGDTWIADLTIAAHEPRE